MESLPKVCILKPLAGAGLLQREFAQEAVTEELGAFNRGGGRKLFLGEEGIVRLDTATQRKQVQGTAGRENFQHQGTLGARERGAETDGSKSCQR